MRFLLFYSHKTEMEMPQVVTISVAVRNEEPGSPRAWAWNLAPRFSSLATLDESQGSLSLFSYLQNGQVMKDTLQNYLTHHRYSLDVIQNKHIFKEGPKTLLQTIWLSRKMLGNSRSKWLAKLRSSNWRWSGYLELVHHAVHKINTTISLHSLVITTNQGHILTWA